MPATVQIWPPLAQLQTRPAEWPANAGEALPW
jgi:hypothetical protein